MSTHQFPAGTYYFGDPCYVINDNWMNLLESTDFLEDYSSTEWKTRAASTAYGDGTYHGMGMMSQTSFPVDAGVIGVVPLNEMEVPADKVPSYGKMFTMNTPFTFEAKEGCFYINGDLVLDTSPDDYDEE